MVTDTFVTAAGSVAVPAGATQADVNVYGYWGGAFPAAGEVLNIDTVKLTVGSLFNGVHTGKGVFAQGIANLAAVGGPMAGTFRVASTGSEQDVSTAAVLFNPDPTVATQIIAHVTMRDGSASATNESMRCRIGISTDGGVTYTFGTEAIIIVGTSAGGAQNGMMTAVHAVATVPTDDIWVKVQIRLDAGTVANYNFSQVAWTAFCCPVFQT